MTKEEAWKIIQECRGWNTSQKNMSGDKLENELLDAKRAALKTAWETLNQ